MKTKFSYNIAVINLTNGIKTIGAENVCTYLRSRGFRNTFLIHLFFKYGQGITNPGYLKSLIELLGSLNPDVIGLSLMSIGFNAAKNLSSLLKKHFPDTPLVWGGIHPTLVPEESIKHCDMLIRGEGEEPFYELVSAAMDGKSAACIENLWLKDNKRIIRNKLRPYMDNLDALPYPKIDWERTYVFERHRFRTVTTKLYNKYGSMRGTFYDIIASRGCPYVCTYCSNCVLNELQESRGKVMRFRSIRNIIEELHYVKRTFPNTAGINFQDDAFGALDIGYLKEFAHYYKNEINIPFHIRIIPSMISEEKIKVLKEAGLASAVLGLQGSDRINRYVYKRDMSRKRFIEIARILRKYNIAGRYDIITRNPYSKKEDIVETINTLSAIPKPYFLLEFPLAFLPETALTKKAIDDGIISPELNYYNSRGGLGDGKEQFPLLAVIRTMTPYTPSGLIRFFLRIHGRGWAGFLIRLYSALVYAPERRIIEIIIRNYRITYIVQRILMKTLQKKSTAA
ncbi:MAG: cobalamin-dependent protein [Candidatus Omnitrophica bacterium]|nr:cobalamin-dependent protein [Candidatus Omnitrophota bacterium]